MTEIDSTRRKYVVGFSVHEARELSSDGSAIDPLVIVKSMGREYKTQLKRDKLQHVKFEESFIWNDLELTESEFNMSFIEFELQSALVFTRNEVVGAAKVQLAMVRRRPNHTYNNKTLQLTATTSLTAKLKVSVFCYGEGDEPPKPENDEDAQHDEALAAQLQDLGAAVLGTSAADSQFTQAYHLFVHVHRAEHLGGGKEKFNPYITCEFNGHTLALPSTSNTNTISSDELFKIPVLTPLFADSVVIRVWNKNRWGGDEVIVQGRLSFSLLRMHAMAPKWFNFYGFDKEEVPDPTKLTSMGEAAEANTYMGRLLISARVSRVNDMEDLHRPAVIKGMLTEEPPQVPITFVVDVLEVAGVQGRSAWVTLSIGKKKKKTKPALSDAGVLDSGTGRFVFEGHDGRFETFEVPVPSEADNQLDVILSLYVDSGGLLGVGPRRVGFKRLKISEIRDWTGVTGPPQWIAMRTMAHLPSSVDSGSVLISIFKSDMPVKERGKSKNKRMNFEVRAYIVKARNLRSVAEGRPPNPLAELSCAGTKVTSRALRSTVSPSWGECLRLPIALYSAKQHFRVQPEPVQLAVWDEEESVFHSVPDEQLKVKGEKQEQQAAALGLTDIGIGLARDLQHAIVPSAELASDLKDRFGELTGDLEATKRRHAWVGNRRLIGKVQVTLSNVVQPGTTTAPYLKWLKLKGGVTGAADVGDILVGFEMMEERHSKSVPVKTTTPPLRECTLSVALLGLRHLSLPGIELGRPKVMIVSPNLDGFPDAAVIEWKKKPDFAFSKEDDNRRWVKAGKAGFEFLSVVHIPAKLPKSAVHEPELVFRLFPEEAEVHGTAVAEGRFSLAMDLPWASPADAKLRVAADGDYEGAFAHDHVAGLETTNKADDTEKRVNPYVDVEFQRKPIQIVLSSSDAKSFPPLVSSCPEDSPASEEGVKAGDWIVGCKGPRDQVMQFVGTWTTAEAQQWLSSSDPPVTLRFRHKDRKEVTLRFSRDGKTGLTFTPDQNIRPPRIASDTSPDGRWKAAGVKPGWFVVDINGIDCSNFAGNDPRFHQLLAFRPNAITCQDLGSGEAGAGAAAATGEDQAYQMGKPVALSGLPSALSRAMEAKRKMDDGALVGTRVPRPSLDLPPVTEPKCLNMRICRSGVLDVRGFVSLHTHNHGDEVEEHDKSRPTVNGKMEDFLDPGAFRSTDLWQGGSKIVGQVKFAFTVVLPPDPKWVEKIRDRYDPKVTLFDPKFLRLRFKRDQPHRVRLRAYIVRGLNISGVNRKGYANPYLFFRFGGSTTALEGYRQMGSVEPRFFRTEECDLSFPEEALIEIGLSDWQGKSGGGGSDPRIGSTVIDLEDRWFSERFQDYLKQSKVPVEYRSIVSEDKISKGSLEMWVEVLDAQQAPDIPVSTLYQPPPVEVEVRVVVWGVREMSGKLLIDEYGDERPSIDIISRCAVDCRNFIGAQSKEQETDIHHSADSFAEFNWRFVFSRVQVTKGVPLDCFIQLSLWESFTLRRPMLLCESLIDMKNYCKRVAYQRTTVQVESEIALTSKHLEQLQAQDGDLFGGGGGDSDSDSDEDDDDDDDRPRRQAAAQAAVNKQKGPAALMKVLVQVLPQTEANMPDNNVGLGRNVPNQNPALPYPATGRNWQATLPTVTLAVDQAIQTYGKGRRMFRCLVFLLLVIIPICLLHWIKGVNECAIIMSSCADANTCPACQRCRSQADQKTKFCYYSIFFSADTWCVGRASIKNLCNIKLDKTECSTLDPNAAVGIEGFDAALGQSLLLSEACQNPAIANAALVARPGVASR